MSGAPSNKRDGLARASNFPTPDAGSNIAKRSRMRLFRLFKNYLRDLEAKMAVEITP